MIQTPIKIFYVASLLFIVLASIVAFLVSTPAGLHTIIQFSRAYLPGIIKIHHLQGTLWHHFTVGTLEYQNKNVQVKINQLEVQWNILSLVTHQSLSAQWHDLQLTTPPGFYKDLTALQFKKGFLNMMLSPQKIQGTGGLTLDQNKNIKLSFYLPHSKEKHWEATAFLESSGHHLSLKGTGRLSPKLIADLELEGDDFPLIKTDEYQVNISPRLKLYLTPTTRYLSGTVLVPYAQINPQTIYNSLSLPDEIVYKKHKKTPVPFTLNSTMDIDIEMGKAVAINLKGLKGHLGGILQVKQSAQNPINVSGELSVKDGTYKAYGQDLAIKQGQLIFTGGPVNNPEINLRAAKKINNSSEAFSNSTQPFDLNASTLQNSPLSDIMTLGVEVTGRLSNPKIQLFSIPATLSQADILSMLVLGRPASQANKAGGQLLLTAISSMNLGSNSNSLQLLEQLKQSSGIDFNVQTNTNYNQATNTVSDSTAFVLGKSISKKVYLSYNIGLSQTDTNILTLKYLLNKFFSIQVSNSDTSSAIDVLYTANKRVKKDKSHD